MNHDAWHRGWEAYIDVAADLQPVMEAGDPEWRCGWLYAAEYASQIRAGLDHSHAKERHSE